jgi:predicted ABC-type transport system involved in lysophospholipase L1 biosynthesis ATPase subunit
MGKVDKTTAEKVGDFLFRYMHATGSTIGLSARCRRTNWLC